MFVLALSRLGLGLMRQGLASVAMCASLAQGRGQACGHLWDVGDI